MIFLADKTKLELFNRNLFLLNNLDDLPREKIYQSLKIDKFACIRGLVAEVEVMTAKATLAQKFSRSNDRPTLGESPDDVKTNFQKLSVGSVHSSHHIGSYARLLRTFYNPLWEKDIYKMHHIFKTMIKLRNRLTNKPDNFATEQVDDGLWTAARIHQYPRGGGFMGAHRDRTLANVSKQASLNYYQLLLIMTKKGIDFTKGGGFIEYKRQRIIFEEACELGDIILYDSNTIHGVEDIDPHQLLDLDTVSGRLAAFVSLYKSIESK